ncbi:hypothetical protein [Helicobacter sp.]|uniref:type II toxin-antitoxin system RelE family toxin n=1 Tax=Helicobacter sp. TaxID=218 RepID=UPI0025C2E30B|nr:hypothetical protein [Helicobacter sp.]
MKKRVCIMYEVVIELKENLFVESLNLKDKRWIKNKLLDLQKGNFNGDKALKGRYKGKFRKRAGGLPNHLS